MRPRCTGAQCGHLAEDLQRKNLELKPVLGFVFLQIESSYKDMLEYRCHEERIKQRRVRAWRGVEEARKMELTSCNKLKEQFSRTQYVR